MYRRYVVAIVLFVSGLCIGCGGPSVTTNPTPVEVTFQVKRGGRPVDDVNLNLQPTVSGTEASGEVNDGVASLTVTPGTYTYFVSQGKSSRAYDDIPEPFRSGAMDRTLVIERATSVEIALD